MRWISSLSEKPVHHRPRILAARLHLTDVTKGSTRLLSLGRVSVTSCIRESCIRENRTCSLSGGRRLARQRASSDPTPMTQSNESVKTLEEEVDGRPLTKESVRQPNPR